MLQISTQLSVMNCEQKLNLLKSFERVRLKPGTQNSEECMDSNITHATLKAGTERT